MLKFSYKNSDNDPLVEITLSPHSTLTEVLEQFEAFLKAAGYCFDGVVNIVDTEITDEDIQEELDIVNDDILN